MLPPKKQKVQTHKHMPCVICGGTFAATYDAGFKEFKPFHLVAPKEEMPPCEDRVYEQLLRLLTYLHSLNNSVTIAHLIFEYEWEEYVAKKKDYLEWCLRVGYLTIDNFKRIEIPGRVQEEGEDLFESTNLEREDKLKEAVEILKQLLKRMIAEGELEPVETAGMFTKQGELEQGPSKLYQNIDTNDVKLKRNKPGMTTAGRTGAKEVEKRISTASTTRERQRLEDK